MQERSSQTGATVRRRLARIHWPFWIALIVVIVLWDTVAGRMSNSLVLVPSSAIGHRALDLWQNENLLRDITTSGIEFALGFLLASVLGIALGTISGYWRSIGAVVDPFVNAAYAMPVIALGPLFIIGLGLGVASKVAIVALSAVFPVILNTTAGIMATDRAHLELGRAFGLTSAGILWKISLPSSLPYILAGLRVAVGRALTAIVAGELFGAQAGLGLRILTSATTFDTAGVFVATLILSAAGIVLTRLISLLELRLAPWRA